MSVYTYRLTTRTVRTTDGSIANLTECLGPGPSWRASGRAISDFVRKLDTGRRRGDELALTGLFAESDEDGAAVYVGNPSVYTDARPYVPAKDTLGIPLRVVNPRKVPAEVLTDAYKTADGRDRIRVSYTVGRGPRFEVGTAAPNEAEIIAGFVEEGRRRAESAGAYQIHSSLTAAAYDLTRGQSVA